uniref:Uncharacterized protein n=1 Tax=Caenorhabditis japonica TaxID=281687 RepID=A0A8R1DIA8_CAEJA
MLYMSRTALPSSQQPPFQFDELLSLTGLIVLCIVLTAVVVIFFGCYLMMRFMHRALTRDDSKDMLRGSANQYNNVVMHSKRVYEIQAEEGCFSGAPDPLDPNEIEDENTTEPQITSIYIEDDEPPKVRKPETGDLRAIRSESYEDDPKAMLRKKQKVHKDSVCAFLFKPQPEPNMV